ncbi:MAG: SDR family oxidoreductase [Planctomycetes bacterium]|nr:SDR family oxidoreductase [Planctomycetota bacterium]
MDFTGKAVIVTGASIGMGRETAVQFAARGAKVVVNYARAEDQAQETLATIQQAGGTAVLCQGDVSREEDAARIVATAVDAFGRLDVLVNNAGTTAFIPFTDLDAATPEVWTRLYATNVMGAFFCARAAASAMRKTGGGVIINNASVSGHRPQGSSIPYCSSKAALLHLTRCLAVALGPDIRVCSVSPGYIEDTRWNRDRPGHDPAAAHQTAVELSLLKRVGASADVAGAILYLASDAAGFVTGIDVLVDGGRQFRV